MVLVTGVVRHDRAKLVEVLIGSRRRSGGISGAAAAADSSFSTAAFAAAASARPTPEARSQVGGIVRDYLIERRTVIDRFERVGECLLRAFGAIEPARDKIAEPLTAFRGGEFEPLPRQ